MCRQTRYEYKDNAINQTVKGKQEERENLTQKRSAPQRSFFFFSALTQGAIRIVICVFLISLHRRFWHVVVIGALGESDVTLFRIPLPEPLLLRYFTLASRMAHSRNESNRRTLHDNLNPILSGMYKPFLLGLLSLTSSLDHRL